MLNFKIMMLLFRGAIKGLAALQLATSIILIQTNMSIHVVLEHSFVFILLLTIQYI